jgi:hypothetical protein
MVLAGYHGAGWRVVERVSRDQGEFARDCAGKGESSRAQFAQVIGEALWLLGRLRIERSNSSSAFS